VHVCIDARTVHPHFPGIGRYTANLVRAVAEQLEHEDRLTVLQPSPPGGLEIESLGGPRVHILRCPVPLFSLRQQWAVPRLTRPLALAAYHSPYFLMPLWLGVPSVVTVHDLIPLHHPEYFSAFRRWGFLLAMRLALRAARAVIAVSGATARELRDLLAVPAPRIHVIPEAASPAFRPQAAEEIARVRSRLGLPDRYVLHVGSNKPHKNLVGLIEAWDRLRPVPSTLVLAGPWDDRYPEARRAVSERGLEGQVRFLGPVVDKDLPALYGGAQLLVLPSYREGFGLPAIEAMACGLPVACSNAGALPEVVGDAAVLFDPRDCGAIAAAIASLLEDDDARVELAEKGVARSASFSWERCARETLDVYRRLGR
jgi:glycosyltransferase involved in cell wall biosynthesis